MLQNGFGKSSEFRLSGLEFWCFKLALHGDLMKVILQHMRVHCKATLKLR